MKIDNDLIIAYLSGELNKEDKKEFELRINRNNDLKTIIDDLNANDIILQNMPKYKTSSDFMVGLNSKIEAYKKSNIPWYTKILDQVAGLDIIPKVGGQTVISASSGIAITSILFILSFTLFKINSSYSSNLSSNFDENQDLIAIVDDSLSQKSDSLSHDPTLLISKDK